MQEGTVTIAITGTTSTSLAIREKTIVGIICPVLDSTTLTLQASIDDATFYNIWLEAWSAALTSAATTGSISLALNLPFPFRFIRIVAGSAQNTAAVTFTICSK